MGKISRNQNEVRVGLKPLAVIDQVVRDGWLNPSNDVPAEAKAVLRTYWNLPAQATPAASTNAPPASTNAPAKR